MRESLQTGLSRGRRSRNKVSVGEPAEGSFQQQSKHKNFLHRVSTFIGGLALLHGVCSVRLLGWIRSFSNLFLGSSKLSFSTPLASVFFFSHQLLDLDTNVTSAKCIKQNTPFNDGPLGSRNDEERGKMRKCSMNCRI